jgi:hypothetical protein
MNQHMGAASRLVQKEVYTIKQTHHTTNTIQTHLHDEARLGGPRVDVGLEVHLSVQVLGEAGPPGQAKLEHGDLGPHDVVPALLVQHVLKDKVLGRIRPPDVAHEDHVGPAGVLPRQVVGHERRHEPDARRLAEAEGRGVHEDEAEVREEDLGELADVRAGRGAGVHHRVARLRGVRPAAP